MTPAERCLARFLIWIDRQLADEGDTCAKCHIGIHAEADATVVNGRTYCQKCGPYAEAREAQRANRSLS